MNKTPEADKYELPGIYIESAIEDISIMLGEDQYGAIMQILSSISLAASFGEYLK